MGGIEYTGDRILLRLSIVYGVNTLQMCSPHVFSQEKQNSNSYTHVTGSVLVQTSPVQQINGVQDSYGKLSPRLTNTFLFCAIVSFMRNKLGNAVLVFSEGRSPVSGVEQGSVKRQASLRLSIVQIFYTSYVCIPWASLKLFFSKSKFEAQALKAQVSQDS